MPFVLLDIRSTLKQDLDGNPTELAYGTILRRPGDIFTDDSAPDTNTHAYIKKILLFVPSTEAHSSSS